MSAKILMALAFAVVPAAADWQTIDAIDPVLSWQGRTFDNQGSGSRSFSWPGVRFSFNLQGATWCQLNTMFNNTQTRLKVFVDEMEAAWLWVGDSISGDKLVETGDIINVKSPSLL